MRRRERRDDVRLTQSFVHHVWMLRRHVRRAGLPKEGLDMYIARFSYSVMPANRQGTIDFIHREVQAAGRVPLKARMLVPPTRPGRAVVAVRTGDPKSRSV
jgi:hypothetical protein